MIRTGQLFFDAITGEPSIMMDDPWANMSSGGDTTAPVFDEGASYEFNVTDGSVAAGDIIYSADATDDVGVVSYVLGGDDASLFDLDISTGALSFKAAPTADTTYDVTITAKDASNNSSTQTLIINHNNDEYTGNPRIIGITPESPEVIGTIGTFTLDDSRTATLLGDDTSGSVTVDTIEIESTYDGLITYNVEVDGHGNWVARKASEFPALDFTSSTISLPDGSDGFVDVSWTVATGTSGVNGLLGYVEIPEEYEDPNAGDSSVKVTSYIRVEFWGTFGETPAQNVVEVVKNIENGVVTEIYEVIAATESVTSVQMISSNWPDDILSGKFFFDGNGDLDTILVNPFHGGGLTFHPDYYGGVTDPVDQFFVDFVDLDDTDLLSVNYEDMDFKLDDYVFTAQVLDVSGGSSSVAEQIDFFDIDDDGTIDWAYHFDGVDSEAAIVTINDSYQAESMTLTYIDGSTSFDLAVIANHHVVGLYFDV